VLRFSAEAARQVAELRAFYERKDRPEATRRLRADLADARRRIEANPAGGASYPRPYPSLARFGFRWIKARIYWISWQITADGPVVMNVLHDSADLEGRASPDTDTLQD
jgi:plasmid stabilization system protein ParE